MTAALVTGRMLLIERAERERALAARTLTVFKLSFSRSLSHINQNQLRIDTMVKDRSSCRAFRDFFFFFPQLPLGVNCAKKIVALCTLKIVPHQLK